MRFRKPLDDLLGNPVRVRVLRVLCQAPGNGFTGRELARRAGVSPSQAIAALGQLEASGAVFREIAGRSHLWRLSAEHVLADQARSLFRQESRALPTLQSELKQVLRSLPVNRAWLFGSVARGEERPTSDIDLLVRVRSKEDRKLVEDRLSEMSAHFALRFGNPLSTFVWEEGSKSARPSESFLKQVLSEGIALED